MADYYLLGKSLPHSFSPEIHAKFGYDYQIKELPNEDSVKEFVNAKKYLGLNVTIPYKQTVIPLLDEISCEAKEAGAVNTIVNRNGKLFGYNTDISGMQVSLELADIDLKDKCVMILGSGGTSKTAEFICKKVGAKKIYIVSRSGTTNYNNCYDYQDTQIIINATPVGMYPDCDGEPVDISKFLRLEGVFDAIYNPLKTRMIREALKLKIKAVGGLLMLTTQAKLARDIFLNSYAVNTLAKDICLSLYKDKCNIVLIGMAGSGKTTIGKMLSKKLDKAFVDTDLIIEEKTGMKIPEIFKKYGEAYFRDLEEKTCKEVGVKQNQIIATGGGAVLREASVRYLSANGYIVQIMRDIDKLATCNRPLSQGFYSLKELYIGRKPIYDKITDCFADNNGKKEDCIKEILNSYEKHTCY